MQPKGTTSPRRSHYQTIVPLVLLSIMKALRTAPDRLAALSSGACLRPHFRQHQLLIRRAQPRLGCRVPFAPTTMSVTISKTSETSNTDRVESPKQLSSGTRVCVLGGSIAGMLAAAAISPFVDEVVILDKEAALNGGASEEELRQVGSMQIHPKCIVD